MNRTALVLAFGFTLTGIACGGSDDTSTDATGANGAGAAGTAGATAGSAGASGGTGGTAGSGGSTGGTGGSGGSTGGNGGSGGSVGGAGGSGGAQACPATLPSQGAACTQSCTYPTTLCGSCSTKTVCSCTAAGTFACQTDPSDTCYCACTGGCGGPKGGSGGGPGGSGGAPGGTGGAPPKGGSGGAPPTDCPPAGSPCVATLECAKSGTVTICDGGVAWQGVDTGAKSDAACDPTGTWGLTYGDVQVPPGFCTQPGKPPTIVVKKAPSGKLLATFGGGGSSVSIDATTCTMKASHSSTATNPSETWTESTTASLKVAGDTATGTYTLANAGFCNASVSGPLDAVRK